MTERPSTPIVEICRNARGDFAIFHFADIRLTRLRRVPGGIVVAGNFSEITLAVPETFPRRGSVPAFAIDPGSAGSGRAPAPYAAPLSD